MAALAVGLAGMILIIAGWVVALRSIPPIELSILYAAGSLLLTLYAYMLGDPIFTALNALAFIIALANIARYISKRKGSKPRG
ncbi:MAG: hypothetical protein GXO09_01630 [Crenarchaeota archaeon]|nr:hypothetical protein [Thermoproteota archaeon]